MLLTKGKSGFNCSNIQPHLERGKQHHLLLGAVNLFVEQLPLGLLVDEVDSDWVALGVEVVEGVELESQQERVEVSDSLLHQR